MGTESQFVVLATPCTQVWPEMAQAEFGRGDPSTLHINPTRAGHGPVAAAFGPSGEGGGRREGGGGGPVQEETSQ